MIYKEMTPKITKIKWICYFFNNGQKSL